jgi:hypothetical protein
MWGSIIFISWACGSPLGAILVEETRQDSSYKARHQFFRADRPTHVGGSLISDSVKPPF